MLNFAVHVAIVVFMYKIVVLPFDVTHKPKTTFEPPFKLLCWSLMKDVNILL